MELWARALRDPELAATRAELDGRWRRTIAEVVRYGQERGEFGAADPEEFAVLLASLLDGLAVQIALRDMEVTPDRVRELALKLAERELGCELLEGATMLIDTRIDRRGLLVAGAGLALAGCGVGDSGSGSKKETEKVVKTKVDGDLVYFNWSEYLDPELIKEFEKKYDVKVRQSNFDSMASMLAKLRSGNRYDVIFPDQSVTPRLVASTSC